MLRGLLKECPHALIIIYGTCDKQQKARRIVDMHESSSNDVPWTTLMNGHAREGHHQNVLECLEGIRYASTFPHEVTYVCIMRTYISVEITDKGK